MVLCLRELSLYDGHTLGVLVFVWATLTGDMRAGD